MTWRFLPVRTPFEEGWDAAAVPPPDQPKCPYAEGTREYYRWWEGFDEWAENRLSAERYDDTH